MEIEARINELEAAIPKAMADYSVALAESKRFQCDQALNKAIELNKTLQRLINEEIALQEILITHADLICEVLKAQAN